MNNFEKLLELLVEKAASTTDNDYMEFGEDFDISVPRKLYDRAVGIGLKKEEIAKLYKSKKLEDTVAQKELNNKIEKKDRANDNRYAREEDARNRMPKGSMTEKQFELALKKYGEGYTSDDEDDLADIFEDFVHGILPGFIADKKVKDYIAFQIRGMNREDVGYYYEGLRDSMYDYASKAKKTQKGKVKK
jgi:hypothetical protein